MFKGLKPVLAMALGLSLVGVGACLAAVRPKKLSDDAIAQLKEDGSAKRKERKVRSDGINMDSDVMGLADFMKSIENSKNLYDRIAKLNNMILERTNRCSEIAEKVSTLEESNETLQAAHCKEVEKIEAEISDLYRSQEPTENLRGVLVLTEPGSDGRKKLRASLEISYKIRSLRDKIEGMRRVFGEKYRENHERGENLLVAKHQVLMDLAKHRAVRECLMENLSQS